MSRKIELILKAKESNLPGEFVVYRALPRRELRRVGGFVFFDHFDASAVAPENFDVPPHPHVGLQTVTYLFDGEILHTDSLGFQETIAPGAVNWMTAGKGITHSEQVTKIVPRMHGVQSWVGLPHANRQTEPSFAHFAAENLPVVETNGARVRVLAGNFNGKHSPIPTFQELTYLDIEAEKNSQAALRVESSHELAVYVCEGEIEIAGEKIERFALAKLSDDTDEILFSSQAGARFILFGGEPLPDPTVIYWNFVTDTIGEAKQALIDWEEGRFPKVEKYRKISGAPDENEGEEAKKMKLL